MHQGKSIVHAHGTCQLDQNNSLLIGLPKKCFAWPWLQIIQNASARLIIGVKKRRPHHTYFETAALASCWKERLMFKVLLLTFKSLHDKGTVYLKEHLILYIPLRTLHSSTDSVLCVPTSHYIETSKKASGVKAPSEKWNFFNWKNPSNIRYTFCSRQALKKIWIQHCG